MSAGRIHELIHAYADGPKQLEAVLVAVAVNHFAEHLAGHLATIAKRRDQFAAARR